MKRIGVIKKLYRYPIKSMRGHELSTANLGWSGIDFDRRFALIQKEEQSGFPFLTPRQAPELVSYEVILSNPEDLRNTQILVKVPEGKTLLLQSQGFIEYIKEKHKKDVYVIQLYTGNFDSAPVSLISTNYIQDIEANLRFILEHERFRPNIVIELEGEYQAKREHEFVGKKIRFGNEKSAASVLVAKRDKRCKVITIDPKSLNEDASILKEVAVNFNNCAGVYCVCSNPGVLRVGEELYLE